MVWLYWTAFAVILGAEINADLMDQEDERPALKEAASDEKNGLHARLRNAA